jgi:hypothetical protein
MTHETTNASSYIQPYHCRLTLPLCHCHLSIVNITGLLIVRGAFLCCGAMTDHLLHIDEPATPDSVGSMRNFMARFYVKQMPGAVE